jgi:hypothetical protein
VKKSLLPLLAVVCALPSASAWAQNCKVNTSAVATINAQSFSEQVGRSQACAVVPGITPQKLSAVWASLLSTPRTGGQRFETVPPKGMPTGKTLASEQGVEFDLRSIQDEGIVKLEVFSGGKLLKSVMAPAPNSVLIPNANLQADTSYAWRLLTRKTSYRGSFELPEDDELKDIQAKLEAIAQAENDQKVQLFFQAVVFDDAELYGARDKVLDQLRTMTAQ